MCVCEHVCVCVCVCVCDDLQFPDTASDSEVSRLAKLCVCFKHPFIIVLFCAFTAMFSKLVFGEHSYIEPPELDLPVAVPESGTRGQKTNFNELQVSMQPEVVATALTIISRVSLMVDKISQMMSLFSNLITNVCFKCSPIFSLIDIHYIE